MLSSSSRWIKRRRQLTGRTPTGRVALTALVLVSMTETEFDPALVT
jgi:hypothetical protein